MSAPTDSTRRVSEEKPFTSDDQNPIPEDIWLLRPCEIYREEYSECNSFRGRLYQNYIFGHYIDCQKWKDDYKNCMKFRRNKSVEAVEEVIAHEKERQQNRIRDALNNNIWEYRSIPPAEWADPLPEWEKAHENSILSKAQELKGKSGKLPHVSQMQLCIIQ